MNMMSKTLLIKTVGLCRQECGQPDGHAAERHQDAEARGSERARQEAGERRRESAGRPEGQDEGLGRVRHHTAVHQGGCGCLPVNKLKLMFDKHPVQQKAMGSILC